MYLNKNIPIDMFLWTNGILPQKYCHWPENGTKKKTCRWEMTCAKTSANPVMYCGVHYFFWIPPFKYSLGWHPTAPTDLYLTASPQTEMRLHSDPSKFVYALTNCAPARLVRWTLKVNGVRERRSIFELWTLTAKKIKVNANWTQILSYLRSFLAFILL